jgi:CDGSH-type Zn-finger protein
MSQKPSADREESAISHARPYTAPGVRVFYDRGRCLHFAECVRDLSIDVPAGRMREIRASLCRCAQTENEPFCDNACGRIGWASEAPIRDNE